MVRLVRLFKLNVCLFTDSPETEDNIIYYKWRQIKLAEALEARVNFQPNHSHLTLKEEGKIQGWQGFTWEQINWKCTPTEKSVQIKIKQMPQGFYLFIYWSVQVFWSSPCTCPGSQEFLLHFKICAERVSQHQQNKCTCYNWCSIFAAKKPAKNLSDSNRQCSLYLF